MSAIVLKWLLTENKSYEKKNQKASVCSAVSMRFARQFFCEKHKIKDKKQWVFAVENRSK